MLLIQQELQHTCPAKFREQEAVNKHGLVSVAAATNLVYIDLTGVKVTKGGEKLLESSIVAQQKAGNMQTMYSHLTVCTSLHLFPIQLAEQAWSSVAV